MEGQRTKQNQRKSVLRMRKGFGSIRYISAGRRNAYAVHPPSTSEVREGRRVSVRPGAICYVSDWYTGFAVLTAWHAGKYKPGMEKEIAEAIKESVNLDLSEKGDWNQRACENEDCGNEDCENKVCGNEDKTGHKNGNKSRHRTGHKNGEKTGNKTRQEMKYRSYSNLPRD